MKKNGFTLAELLGVIVILAAIALVAFPPIINQIRKSRTEIDNALNSIILSASEQYLEEQNYPKTGIYCIKLNVLVNAGKLTEPITNSKGNVVGLNSIFYVNYDRNDYFYNLYNNDSEITSAGRTCPDTRRID